jgi:hypothetical protein
LKDIGKRTTHTLAAAQVVEPILERVIGIAAIVACKGRTSEANE